MLAHLHANAREQDGEAERLDDIIIGAGFEPDHGVGVGIAPGEHDHRPLEALAAQQPHRLASVHVGQADVHDHEIGRRVGDPAARGGRAIGLFDSEFGMQRKLFRERFAQILVVVYDQYQTYLAHRRLVSTHPDGFRPVKDIGNSVASESPTRLLRPDNARNKAPQRHNARISNGFIHPSLSFRGHTDSKILF